MAEPIRVVVTGAAGQIAYSLIYQIAKGDVFGPNQPVILHLLDITPMMGVLQGVVMEISDCALPLVREVVPTDKPDVAFKDVEAAFMVGAMPRKEGMERKDLLSANIKIFKVQGDALDKFAKKTVKVLVVGNPANTNALICSKYAPSIPKENFSAMTRLDQNRAQAHIAAKLGIPVSQVRNLIIWGNHSKTQFPDVRNATVTLPNGATLSVHEAIKNDEYLKNTFVEEDGDVRNATVTLPNGATLSVHEAIQNDEYLRNTFVETIQTRGAAVIAARKMSSAMSAAKAAGDHMKSVWQGTPPGEWVSMGVLSDGSYGVPHDLVFSFPVQIKDKKWTIVQGLKIDDFAQKKLDLTAQELLEEKQEALSVCSD